MLPLASGPVSLSPTAGDASGCRSRIDMKLLKKSRGRAVASDKVSGEPRCESGWGRATDGIVTLTRQHDREGMPHANIARRRADSQFFAEDRLAEVAGLPGRAPTRRGPDHRLGEFRARSSRAVRGCGVRVHG